MARETFKAVEIASYERGMQEMETWLAEEVARVCRDYCTETWAEALNWAGVLTNFELRRAENIFFLEAKHSKDALTIRDVVSKAKDAESKSKAADPKENPHQAKA